VVEYRKVVSCPVCGSFQHTTIKIDGENTEVILEPSLLKSRKKYICEKCNSALYSEKPYTYGGRYAIGKWLKNHRKKTVFSISIIDELHKTSGRSTDIGYASAHLTYASDRTIRMTATPYKGKASGSFPVLYRSGFRDFIEKYNHNSESDFVFDHGMMETIEKTQVEKYERSSGAHGYLRGDTKTTKREIPGVTPSIVALFLRNSIPLRLSDLSDVSMPEYKEIRVPVELDERLKDSLNKIDSLKEDVLKNQKIFAHWLGFSLYWMNNPVSEKIEFEDENDSFSFEISGIDLDDGILEKDRRLTEIIAQNVSENRGSVTYFNYVHRFPYMERIQRILKDKYNIQAEILHGSMVAPNEREKWYYDFVDRSREYGHEPVLLTSGSLSWEGLNFYELPTIICG
jgi:hypothetical protein